MHSWVFFAYDRRLTRRIQRSKHLHGMSVTVLLDSFALLTHAVFLLPTVATSFWNA